jgi:hypothetical protein
VSGKTLVTALQLAYVVFLMIYTYEVMFDLRPSRVTPIEITMHVGVLAIFVNQMREVGAPHNRVQCADCGRPVVAPVQWTGHIVAAHVVALVLETHGNGRLCAASICLPHAHVRLERVAGQ